MKRRSYGRDAGLTLRMLFTSGLLGLLYVVFAVVLFNILNVGLVPMLVIVVGIAFFQYYTSDKLALARRGREGRHPRGRAGAARHGRAPVRDGRPAEAEDRDHGHPVPNAFATGRSPKHAAVCVTPASGTGSSRRRSRACSPTSSRTSPTATC